MGHLMLKFTCLFLLFGQIRLPFFDMFLIFLGFSEDAAGSLLGCKARRSTSTDRLSMRIFLAWLLVPLIAGSRLHQHRFGVAAVAKDGHNSDQDSKNRDSKCNTLERLAAAFSGLFHLIGKFVDFIGFHGD